MPARKETVQTPLAYPEPYRDYIRVLAERGKPLNEADLRRGLAVWTGLMPDEWPKATQDLRDKCRETENVRFIPFPANHLLDKPWTRKPLPVEIAPKPPQKQQAELTADEREFLKWRKQTHGW